MTFDTILLYYLIQVDGSTNIILEISFKKWLFREKKNHDIPIGVISYDTWNNIIPILLYTTQEALV